MKPCAPIEQGDLGGPDANTPLEVILPDDATQSSPLDPTEIPTHCQCTEPRPEVVVDADVDYYKDGDIVSFKRIDGQLVVRAAGRFVIKLEKPQETDKDIEALEKCIEEVECEEREREAFTEETDFDPRRVPPGYVARRLKDGIWTEYSHEGRRIDETAWLNGQREGMHYCWFADGTIQQSGPYVDGRQDGLWSTWSQTGQLVSEVTWSRGVMDGAFRGYFAIGVIQCEGNYAGGYADGAWNYYNEDGTLRETQYPKEKLRELKDEGSERCGVRLR